MSALACSVIVPSFNRCPSLEMVLEGLAAQTLDHELFEVIVVLDGSTDSSATMLETWQASGKLPHLRWQQQPNSGQAAARNRGALLAKSELLVFLDDDVVPEPDLLVIHLQHHAAGKRIALLGDCEIVSEASDSLYQRWVWAWWEDLYHMRAQPGRQPGCRDFCAGNVSLRREDFLASGGFDTDFSGYGGEDYELGFRLLEAGIQFVADRNARARHYHRVSTHRVLHAARQEAHGDMLIARKHPALLNGLRLTNMPDRTYRLMAELAMRWPKFGDKVAVLGVQGLRMVDALRLHRLWLKLYYHLRGYAYWRGLHDIFPTFAELRTFVNNAPVQPEFTLDISNGLPREMPQLWIDGPSRVRIVFQGHEIGVVTLGGSTDQPLRTYLAEQIVNQLGTPLWLEWQRLHPLHT